MPNAQPKLFEVYPNGDPYSKGMWVREYNKSFDEKVCIHRGDMPDLRKGDMIAHLRKNYPGCKIKYNPNG